MPGDLAIITSSQKTWLKKNGKLQIELLHMQSQDVIWFRQSGRSATSSVKKTNHY
jgi:hypothetical protein